MPVIVRKSVDQLDGYKPTWEIAYLFPSQGQWSEDEYLDLDTNRRIEFSNGFLEFPPMPTTSHQLLLMYVFGLFHAFTDRLDLGLAMFAGIRVRLWPRKFREPDVVFMLKEHAERIGERFWKGADLAMEIVSGDPKDRRRDLVTKRKEYAKARIAEYWIVDPKEEKITVLRLAGKRYAVHGVFGLGTQATSVLLPGFAIDVTEAFSAGTRKTRPQKNGAKKAKGRST